MRRKNVISRLATLALATLICLLLALFSPSFFSQRTTDEPFTGASVVASPRDLYVVAAPIRLSSTPDLMLTRGVLYADGNAALGTPISRFVLDGPAFHVNASGLKAAKPSSGNGEAMDPSAIAPLVEQLLAMGFDALSIRRGTLSIAAADGGSETLSELQAELSGRRKGTVSARGAFTLRGQRLTFDLVLNPGLEKRTSLRWPLKASVKGGLVEANFEGQFDVAEDLRLTGHAELSTPSLRRIARWFGLPISNADGLNAGSIKGHLGWARQVLTLEKAKISIDGNEANGTLAINLAADRPLVDGTLAFGSLDLGPYVDAARSQSFLFDRRTMSWSLFDLSFPIVKYVDADLRISAPAVVAKGLSFGRGAASITVRSGKLIANIAELELQTGTASAQVTIDANELIPHYTLRGKIENLDTAAAAAALLGTSVLAGRSILSAELAASGQTPAEVSRTMSGKASLSMPDGGKLALDVRSLRAMAKTGDASGWGTLAKGQTSLENVEARAYVMDGILISELVQARFGPGLLVATGNVDLVDRTLDLRLAVKAEPPVDRQSKSADVVAEDAVNIRGPWREPAIRGDTNTSEAQK